MEYLVDGLRTEPAALPPREPVPDVHILLAGDDLAAGVVTEQRAQRGCSKRGVGGHVEDIALQRSGCVNATKGRESFRHIRTQKSGKATCLDA